MVKKLWWFRNMSIWEHKEKVWEWRAQRKKHLWCLICQRDMIFEVGIELGNLRKMCVCMYVCVCVVCVYRCWPFPCEWMCLTMWPFSCWWKMCVESFLVCDYDQYLSNTALLTLFAWMPMRPGKKVTLRKTEPLRHSESRLLPLLHKIPPCIFCTSLPIQEIELFYSFWERTPPISYTANSKWFA